jgi:hypothetical protein
MRHTAIGFALLVLAAGCDGHTNLGGEVVGPDDKPVAGAAVKLFERDHPERVTTATTDETGHYSLGLTHSPTDLALVVTVAKDGYKPLRKEFTVGKREEFPKKLVLEPEAKAPAKE